jgi:hypothetical protein
MFSVCMLFYDTPNLDIARLLDDYEKVHHNIKHTQQLMLDVVHVEDQERSALKNSVIR